MSKKTRAKNNPNTKSTKSSGATLPPPPSGGYARFSIKKLDLDSQNPRLVEFTLGKGRTQFDLLRALYEQMAVEEVAMSIAYNGYFPHEPLIIEPRDDGRYTVIEGNRRLAAVRLLLDADLRRRLQATDLPNIDKIASGRREELADLPAVVSTRRDSWRYLGFKHVNGPSTWGAYAKAQYVASVHNNYNVPLSEIAKQIGDYSNTVERQYRGLMVIEQAERARVFDRENVAKKRFHFNYIYTAMENPHFRQYLNVNDRLRNLRNPVPRNRIKALGELLLWLYGNRSENIESRIQSQNPDLATLGTTISSPEGVKALRSGLPLSVAHDISLGDEHVFRRSLLDAKNALQRALGTMTTGYTTGSNELTQLAISIEQLASELVNNMHTKRTQNLRPRRRHK